jgi:hypothetical protein
VAHDRRTSSFFGVCLKVGPKAKVAAEGHRREIKSFSATVIHLIGIYLIGIHFMNIYLLGINFMCIYL